jgi:hypothetical protein
MNLMGLVHRLLDDMQRLPLIFKLFLLYAAGAAGWQWWKKRKQAELVVSSMAWPVYQARVVWAQVSDRLWEGEDGPSYWEGVLTYSYTVPGYELEVGEYRKRFEDEDEANNWARALRDTFVNVRVDPTDVKRSIWVETPILAVPSPALPELESSRLERIARWDGRTVLAAIIFCVAAFGAFFAAWIQLSCLKGKPLVTAEANGPVFFGMHIGAILCAITSSFVAKRGKWSRSNWQKPFKTGTTSTAIKILGFYTTAVFLYGWLRMAANDGNPGHLGVLMFSAIWLIFYVTSAAASVQAIQY